MSNIPLDRIIVESALQSRVTLDAGTVAEYLRSAEEAADEGNPWPFPPIQMVGGYLIDGHHRLEVAKRLGMETIPADEQPGESEEDCIRAAVGANANHGLPRSNSDKRRAVELALATWPDWSARQIAKACKLSHTYVNQIRSPEPELEVETFPPSPEYIDDPDETEVETFPSSDVPKVETFPSSEEQVAEPKMEQVPPSEAQPPEHTGASIVHDGLGRPVPESLRSVQTTTVIGGAIGRAIDKCRREVISQIKDEDWPRLSVQEVEIDFKSIKRLFVNAAYWTACPRCDGDGCEKCRGNGFLAYSDQGGLSKADKEILATPSDIQPERTPDPKVETFPPKSAPITHETISHLKTGIKSHNAAMMRMADDLNVARPRKEWHKVIHESFRRIHEAAEQW